MGQQVGRRVATDRLANIVGLAGFAEVVDRLHFGPRADRNDALFRNSPARESHGQPRELGIPG